VGGGDGGGGVCGVGVSVWVVGCGGGGGGGGDGRLNRLFGRLNHFAGRLAHFVGINLVGDNKEDSLRAGILCLTMVLCRARVWNNELQCLSGS